MKDYTKDPTVPLPLAALLNDIQRALVPEPRDTDMGYDYERAIYKEEDKNAGK